MKSIKTAFENAAKTVGDAANNVGRTAELVKTIHPYLTESEGIKNEVRGQLDSIPQEKRSGGEYDSLIKLHDEIEAKHDQIYHRADNLTDNQSAINDCNTWIGEQRGTKAKFDLAFNKYMPPAEAPAPAAKATLTM